MSIPAVTTAGVPAVVTAALTTAILDAERNPIMLDGPLAWAAVQRELAAGRDVPPVTADWAPDLPIGLSRWDCTDMPGVWGWCTSTADYQVVRRTSGEIRRKPAVDAMARYIPDRRHHLGLGPHKARDTVVSQEIIPTLRWHVLVDDHDLLRDLLTIVTHLGRGHGTGHGRIAAWRIQHDDSADAWRRRPLPRPDGTPQGIRAPYHHQTRRAPC